MIKLMLPVVIVVAVGLTTVTRSPTASEYLLEIVADENLHITSVRDADGRDFDEAAFERIEGFDLVLTKSLLFSEISYLYEGQTRRCCKPGGSWMRCAEGTRTLVSDAGEVVGQYELVEGEWREAKYMYEEHTSAVILRSAQQSHVLAVVEKDAQLYGMIISAEGTIWYDPKEFAPTD